MGGELHLELLLPHGMVFITGHGPRAWLGKRRSQGTFSAVWFSVSFTLQFSSGWRLSTVKPLVPSSALLSKLASFLRYKPLAKQRNSVFFSIWLSVCGTYNNVVGFQRDHQSVEIYSLLFYTHTHVWHG